MGNQKLICQLSSFGHLAPFVAFDDDYGDDDHDTDYDDDDAQLLR